jgi:hypothetical protein
MNAVSSEFTAYTTDGNVKDIAVAYNPNGQYAIVWSGTETSRNLVKYQVIDSAGTLIGFPVEVIGGTSASYNQFNPDVIWDGSQYLLSFGSHVAGGTPVESIQIYSFDNSSSQWENQASAMAVSEYYPMGYPNFLSDGTDIWLFFNQTNMDGSGNPTGASIIRWRDPATSAYSPTILVTEPNNCSAASGNAMYNIPSAANYNGQILVAYDAFCADMGISQEVYDIAINANGTLNPKVTYSSGELGTASSLGSSVTCRSAGCFISLGDESSNAIFLFDPGMPGGFIIGTATIFSDTVNGIQFPKTVIQ